MTLPFLPYQAGNEAALAVSSGNGLRNGLVSYWKSDEGAPATTTADATGRGHTGTLINSPTWVAGKINNAINYTAASSQYTEVPYSTDFNFSATGSNGQWSIAGWVNMPSTQSSYAGIISFGSSSSGNWSIQRSGTSSQIYVGYSTTLNVIFAAGSFTAIADSTWHHFCLVNDKTAGFAYWYVDGSLFDTKSLSLAPAFASTTTLKIGSDRTPATFIDGSLDEVGIWNRALTSTEASNLWASGSGLSYPF